MLYLELICFQLIPQDVNNIFKDTPNKIKFKNV
jgi:hypothetical protein